MLIALTVSAQVVTPVQWSSTPLGDSIRVTATIEKGWHMTLISIGDSMIGEEFTDTYSVTMAEAQPIRFNACDDKMCTAPEHFLPEVPVEEVLQVEKAGTLSTIGTFRTLLSLFLLGLLGGLLAIFTPCVWPIIPMTVSFFLKKGGGVRDAVVYGLSIILIYVGLGLAVTVLFGASALNEISTNAVVNIFFFLLLVVFALSFFGLFEITLPDSWSTRVDAKARTTGGWISILLMAFTLVIVSFSCTAPIIGTLLVEAAGKSLLAPTIGMLGFAIALALPFTLFALFPQWLQSMPKSGNWMEAFKVTLAFIELALSFKFLSVADMAYGWGILPRWLFIALWIGCFAGLGVYLLVKGYRLQVTGGRRIGYWLVALASLGFAGYLVPGLWGAPVKAIAAFAPPMPIAEQEVFHDYETGLAYARQENRPILLDFTGYGCVNCRKMEAYVLSDPRVKDRLRNYVVIELYVDSRESIDRFAEGIKSMESGTVGEVNSKIQREIYGSNAQPYFIQLDAMGRPITEPYAFNVDVDEFLEWLQITN